MELNKFIVVRDLQGNLEVVFCKTTGDYDTQSDLYDFVEQLKTEEVLDKYENDNLDFGGNYYFGPMTEKAIENIK